MAPKHSKMKVYVQYPRELEPESIEQEFMEADAAIAFAKHVVAQIERINPLGGYLVQVRQEPFGPDDDVWTREKCEVEPLG